MRRQDELQLLYHHLERWNRKFVLSDLDRYASEFDGPQIEAFVEPVLLDADTLLRNQASFSMEAIQAGVRERSYGVSSGGGGAWSQFGSVALSGAVQDISIPAVDQGARRDSMDQVLRPLVDRVAGLIENSEFEFSRHLSGLSGRLRHEKVWDALESRWRRDPGFEPLNAMALAGSGWRPCRFPRIDDDDLVRGDPDILMALGRARPFDFHEYLELLGENCGPHGLVNLAVGARFSSYENLPDVIDYLLGVDDVWTTVCALRLVEELGQPALASRLIEVFEKRGQSFVRLQAIRALGGVGGPLAVEFCLRVLASSESGLRAQAIESLVRARCSRDELRRVTRPFLSDPRLRVRANALLAHHEPREDRFPREFKEILSGKRALERVEAVFCLGYWQTEWSRRILSILSRHDPSLIVRRQAIKSMARHPVEKSMPVLLDLVMEETGSTAAALENSLSRFQDSAGSTAIGMIKERIGRTTDALTVKSEAILVRALGRLSISSPDDAGMDIIRRGLESHRVPVVRAALECLAPLAHRLSEDVVDSVRQLQEDDDPDVQFQTRFVQFFLGDLNQLEWLSGSLLEPDDLGKRALRWCHEIGVVSDWIIPRRKLGFAFEAMLLAHSSGVHSGSVGYEGASSFESTGTFSSANRLLDGEFEVRETPFSLDEIPESSDERDRDPEATDELSVLQEIEKQLGTLDGRSVESVDDEEWAGMDSSFSILDSESRLDLLPPREVPPPRSRSAAPAWLALRALDLMILVGLGLLFFQPGGSRQSRLGVPVAAFVVEGPGSVGFDRTLTVGEMFEAPAGSSVRLYTPSGIRIDVMGGQLCVTQVSNGGSLVEVEVLAGDCYFEIPRSIHLVVRFGAHEIDAIAVPFALRTSEGRKLLEIFEGSVAVRRDGGLPRTIRSGSGIELN